MDGPLGFKCILVGKYLYAQINARDIRVMCVFHFTYIDKYVYFCTGHVACKHYNSCIQTFVREYRVREVQNEVSFWL